MKQDQDQPNKKSFGRDAEETNQVNDMHAGRSHNEERDEKIKDDPSSKRIRNERHGTKYNPNKRIRPLL